MSGSDEKPRRSIPSRGFSRPPVPVPTPAPAADSWTILRMLNWTAEYLSQQGSASPRLDAEVLLAHVLSQERVYLYTHHDQVVSDDQRAAYRELIRQRAAGAPVAYLVGHKEFYSLTFEVSPAVLIPRPDTETLVAAYLTRFGTRAGVSAVDVGTGSGAIAVACLKRHASSRFWATDRSGEAIEVARRNAARHGVADRLTFAEGDLLEPVATAGPFDAILSNPPYIATAAIADLEPGVLDFEPHLALDGGVDGLEVVRRLIPQAADLLRPEGELLIEIGADQEAPVRAAIVADGRYILGATIRDAGHHPRVVPARRAGS